MQLRYLIEDCPIVLDGTDTGLLIAGRMVGEFTVDRHGNVQCDGLYTQFDGIKARPNSARLWSTGVEKFDGDLTAYAGNQTIIESAEAWAIDRIAGEEDSPFDGVDNSEHRLGHRELLGRAA